MIRVDAMGDACPIPVIKAKHAVQELGGTGVVEILVDNEIAVQNLTKMAGQKGYGSGYEQLGPRQFKVILQIGAPSPEEAEPELCSASPAVPAGKRVVAAISSSCMGVGSDELGHTLMKAFLFALTQQEQLPAAVLFYNGGAALTAQDSPALEDLKRLEAQGVEILTCGTCLDFYGLTDRLAVGGVTNMYDIVEQLSRADLVIRP